MSLRPDEPWQHAASFEHGWCGHFAATGPTVPSCLATKQSAPSNLDCPAMWVHRCELLEHHVDMFGIIPCRICLLPGRPQPPMWVVSCDGRLPVVPAASRAEVDTHLPNLVPGWRLPSSRTRTRSTQPRRPPTWRKRLVPEGVPPGGLSSGAEDSTSTAHASQLERASARATSGSLRMCPTRRVVTGTEVHVAWQVRLRRRAARGGGTFKAVVDRHKPYVCFQTGPFLVHQTLPLKCSPLDGGGPLERDPRPYSSATRGRKQGVHPVVTEVHTCCHRCIHVVVGLQ